MFITKKTILSLNQWLNFQLSGYKQDWEFEFSDPKRLEEFINLMYEQNLSQEEEYALFSLIIASYDEYLSIKKDDQNSYWTKIVNLIKSKKANTFDDILIYWALIDDTSNDLFAVTPRIRDFLQKRTND